jgi:hypothetical protein
MQLLSSTHHDGPSQVWSTRLTLRQCEYHKPYLSGTKIRRKEELI